MSDDFYNHALLYGALENHIDTIKSALNHRADVNYSLDNIREVFLYFYIFNKTMKTKQLWILQLRMIILNLLSF